MQTEVIVRCEEEAKGLVNTLLEDEVIKDFEIMVLESGECKVTFWTVEEA